MTVPNFGFGSYTAQGSLLNEGEGIKWEEEKDVRKCTPYSLESVVEIFIYGSSYPF
jgi:hypothetical protein